MFLKKRSDESGSALVMVIAAVAVAAIIAVTITTSATQSLGFSTASRASTQARAAADAGVNYWLAQLKSGTYPCSQASPAATGVTYTSTIVYKSGTGAALACPAAGTVTGSPASATVLVTGAASSKGAAGNTSGNSAAVRAEISITPAVAAVASVTLTRAVFAEGSLRIYNGSNIRESESGVQDADVYSSGNVVCDNGTITVQGSVWAQGDITPTNQCNVTGDMWAGGNVTTQGGQVGGNLYVAGTGSLLWQNSGSSVNGSIISNGSVTLNTGTGGVSCPTQTATVCGSVVALGGGVSLNNGSTVGGSVLAKGEISLQNGNAKQVFYNAVSTNGSVTYQNGTRPQVGGYIKAHGTIGQSGMASDTANSCALSPSSGYTTCASSPTFPSLLPATSIPTEVGWPSTATVNRPPIQSLPTAGMSASDISLWTSAGYSHVTKGCNDARKYLNDRSYGTTRTLLVVTGCSDPLKWNDVPFPSDASLYSSSDQKKTLTVSADLAIINPSGFQFGDNTNSITSLNGTKHEVAFIVPTGSTGNIRTNGTSISNMYTFFYTPNTVTMQNAITGFYGQIYAGTVDGPSSASTITMHTMNVPGLRNPSGAAATPATPATASIMSRYLVSQ
jgi:hypothetical protein